MSDARKNQQVTEPAAGFASPASACSAAPVTLADQVAALERRARDLGELFNEVLATIQVNLLHGKLTVPSGRARFEEIIEGWRKRQLEIILPSEQPNTKLRVEGDEP